MQELYDKRILHNLLGIKPRAIDHVVVIGPRKPPSSTAREASNSVISAWHEAEMDPEDDHQKRRRDHEFPDDDEEGRYSINWKQPPKKRQKVGGGRDRHTVFTTDDEEDGLTTVLDSEAEDAHYASDIGSPRQRDLEKMEQRRSYWLSKGVGMEDSSSPRR